MSIHRISKSSGKIAVLQKDKHHFLMTGHLLSGENLNDALSRIWYINTNVYLLDSWEYT